MRLETASKVLVIKEGGRVVNKGGIYLVGD
jgi:hypothetical protein